MSDFTIPVLTDQKIETKGMLSPVLGTVRAIEDINIQALSDSFRKILFGLNKIADASEDQESSFSVAEIDISLEIDAKAGFVLVGTASTGTKSAIRVMLKPRKQE